MAAGNPAAIGISNDLSFELAFVQVPVETTLVQQFIVGSALDNFPVFYYENLVCVTNRAQAVGDDKTRSPCHESKEGLLYPRLGAGVHA